MEQRIGFHVLFHTHVPWHFGISSGSRLEYDLSYDASDRTFTITYATINSDEKYLNFQDYLYAAFKKLNFNASSPVDEINRAFGQFATTHIKQGKNNTTTCTISFNDIAQKSWIIIALIRTIAIQPSIDEREEKKKEIIYQLTQCSVFFSNAKEKSISAVGELWGILITTLRLQENSETLDMGFLYPDEPSTKLRDVSFKLHLKKGYNQKRSKKKPHHRVNKKTVNNEKGNEAENNLNYSDNNNNNNSDDDNNNRNNNNNSDEESSSLLSSLKKGINDKFQIAKCYDALSNEISMADPNYTKIKKIYIKYNEYFKGNLSDILVYRIKAINNLNTLLLSLTENNDKSSCKKSTLLFCKDKTWEFRSVFKLSVNQELSIEELQRANSYLDDVCNKEILKQNRAKQTPTPWKGMLFLVLDILLIVSIIGVFVLLINKIIITRNFFFTSNKWREDNSEIKEIRSDINNFSENMKQLFSAFAVSLEKKWDEEDEQESVLTFSTEQKNSIVSSFMQEKLTSPKHAPTHKNKHQVLKKNKKVNDFASKPK